MAYTRFFSQMPIRMACKFLLAARPAAFLAPASSAVVLAYARPAALLAHVSFAVVLADARPAALLAPASYAVV